jgi:hypothetical protein
MLSEISDSQIRMAACTALAAKWLSHDEPSARAWIESLPVSPAEKAELFKAKPKQDRRSPSEFHHDYFLYAGFSIENSTG